MKTETQDITRTIKRDPMYKRFKDVITLNSARINVEALTTEVKEISEIRTKSTVKFHETPSKMVRALVTENLNAQAYRSRLSEICLQSTRVIAQVDRACDKMRDHINLHYAEEIKSFGRTKEDRAIISNTMLRFASNYVSALESLIEMAEIVIADIDKQHYALKLTKESVELLISRENILS